MLDFTGSFSSFQKLQFARRKWDKHYQGGKEKKSRLIGKKKIYVYIDVFARRVGVWRAAFVASEPQECGSRGLSGDFFQLFFEF